MKINRLPYSDETNGWIRILPARSPNALLDSDISADWIVIGAGFAGLAASRRLAENRPNDKIVLLEAGDVGQNASGRNSGFAIDVPHSVNSSVNELEESHCQTKLARSAIKYLENLVVKNKIDCNWTASGKYHAAASSKGAKEILEPFAKVLDIIGEPYTWVDKEQLREKIGCDHHTAAIFTAGGALMNPAALVQGLADTLPENVFLFERSPAIEVEHDSDGSIRVLTSEGSVRAPRMILAVNGFAERFGFLRGRLLHFIAYASLSRQLTPEEQRDYGVSEFWGLTPANAFVGTTMRYTSDYRFLIRQQIDFCPTQRASDLTRVKIAAQHQSLFSRRFPALSNVDLEYTWSGQICLTKNSAPGFGLLAPNIWACVAQNGVGITKATISGLLVADLATGRDNSMIADMESLGRPSYLPPKPFLDIGVHTRFLWEKWRNRQEA